MKPIEPECRVPLPYNANKKEGGPDSQPPNFINAKGYPVGSSELLYSHMMEDEEKNRYIRYKTFKL